MLDFLAILAGLFLATAIVTWLFPGLLRYLWRALLHLVYRFQVVHAERIPATGPALIICNHVSYLDWMVLWAASPRRLRFVLWEGYYRHRLLRFFLSWARHRTVRIDNRTARPHALADAMDAVSQALEKGEVVVVFPEGRLTRNGQMRPFGRGMERILRMTQRDVPVIPACTSGLWGSIWSHRDGAIIFKRPRGIRQRVAVWFGTPMPKSVTAPEIRAAVAEAQADLAIHLSHSAMMVPRWYVATTSRWRGIFRPAFVDLASGTERKLSAGQGLVATWCLSSWLRQRMQVQDGPACAPVGLWLPTGLGSTLANIALSFLRVPTVNLNYTSGHEAVNSAAEQVKMRYVITAKRFLERVSLDLPESIERIYLEDALGAISKGQKLRRFLAVLLLPTWILHRMIGTHLCQHEDLLTIIFSSGSTGEPKGIMLSTRNISANADGFYVGVDMRTTDVMMATLPFFHSFGYTVCLWAPAVIGMQAVYYPDPRAAKEVGELCSRYRCSILLGTATFVRFYLRRCGVDDFKSLRLLICGAEKLPVQLAKEFETKFSVLPLEGYGCTELSPVVCTNLHDLEVQGVHQVANRLGTVGQPIPGVVARACDIETGEPLPPGVEGMLWVKGPNVMVGYFQQPEKTREVVRDGWYRTGDMGLIESDGFIRITGRLSRFAKIAGEMVPLEKLEEEMQDLLDTGDRKIAVCAVPDSRRGERVVVLYLPEIQAQIEPMLKDLHHRGLPNLWIPDHRDFYPVEAFPVLGSGKMDLRRTGELAKQLACPQGVA